jgi:type IV pilus assembly protein PilY1
MKPFASKKPVFCWRLIGALLLVGTGIVCSDLVRAQALAAVPPNILSNSLKPMLMLVAAKDHTLFAPAYSDLEDLAGDGVLDSTFNPSFSYYGYFDSSKCYRYNKDLFEPDSMAQINKAKTNTGIRYSCPASASLWSGNFLNWASMSRLDILRKLLYGGKRSTDSLKQTVLETASLSQDSHAFVKFYAGTDIRDYTPFSTRELTKKTGDNANNYAGLTLCSRSAQDSESGTPQLRLAKGNYKMWAAINGRSCIWTDEQADAKASHAAKLGNKLARYWGNSQAHYGGASLRHESALPSLANDGAVYGNTGPDLTLRVLVCEPTQLGQERCQKFDPGSAAKQTTDSSYKPYGLLQELALPAAGQSSAKAEIGLITGSHDRNLSAGALRKNIGDLQGEIDARSGRFCHAANSTSVDGSNPSLPPACASAGQGAIAALDRITLYGRQNGSYGGVQHTTSQMQANQGSLPAWGNPIGEMLVQALNYYAGNSDNKPPKSKDNSRGISVKNWLNPLIQNDASRERQYGKPVCRPLNILALSSSTLSFDQEASQRFSELPGQPALASYTQRVGSAEGINNSWRAVGTSDTQNREFGPNCTVKYVGNLADVSGICPEAPAIGGAYQIAGAALYGNTHKIQNLSLPADAPAHALNVKTMAVSLGGGEARIKVAIPNSQPQKFVYITPEGWSQNGALALLSVTAISSSAMHGAFLVSWSDALFGGEHDMDLTGYLRYDIIAPPSQGADYQIKITSDIVNVGSNNQAAQGYSVIGVNHANAPAGSQQSQDSADKVYLTHGHGGAAAANAKTPNVVSMKGTLCASQDYREPASNSTGQTRYSAKDWPDHVATAALASGSGLVLNPCMSSAGAQTVHDLDLSVVGSFNMRGAADVLLKDPLWYAAKYGSYDTAKASSFKLNSNGALPSDAWDSQGADGQSCGAAPLAACSDGIPDGYFQARRPELLERQLKDQFVKIIASANTAPVTSTTQLADGSFKYISQFDPLLKTGSVLAYRLGADGNFQSTPNWDAGETLKRWPLTERQIISNQATPQGKNQGISLKWDALNTAYKAALSGVGLASDLKSSKTEHRARALLDYIRGDSQNENPRGEGFAARSSSNLMGTVVNATPWIQSRPSARFFDAMLPAGAPSYAAFSNAYAEREKLLWVGANDGMLHAFKANTGEPVISLVPGALAALLPELATPAAAISAGMDGNPFGGDVVISQTNNGKPSWASYLFAGLGRGAKGLFALNVTDPSQLVESNAAAIFKWQFTPSDDSDMGHVLNQASINRFSGQASPIVLLNSGKWAVLIPNGVNSANGKAALFVLGVDGPDSSGVWRLNKNYTKLLPLGQDSSNGNGMMGVNWLDTDNNGTADYAYATDLKGNVWKFDLSSSIPANWGSAFSQDGVSLPFYTAKTASGEQTLAITSEPVFGFPQQGGVMLVFGTGKSLRANDFPAGGITQRMYGVYDRSNTNTLAAIKPTKDTPPRGTARLLQRKLSSSSNGALSVSRASAGALDLSHQDGWYFDFPSDSEMLLSNPVERSKNIVFTSVRPAPDQSQCSNAPVARLYMLDPNTGLPSTASLGRMSDVNGHLLNIIAIPSADQKVSLSADRSGRVAAPTPEQTQEFCEQHPEQCLTKSCAANTFGYRVIGQNADQTLCMRSFNARIGWREVPGMKTFQR